MKSKLFCVRDQKIGAFNEPFPCVTEGAALRSFQSAVEAGDGDVGKYPADFDLYCIGEFDREAGIVLPYSQPKHLVSGLAFSKKPEDNIKL